MATSTMDIAFCGQPFVQLAEVNADYAFEAQPFSYATVTVESESEFVASGSSTVSFVGEAVVEAVLEATGESTVEFIAPTELPHAHVTQVIAQTLQGESKGKITQTLTHVLLGKTHGKVSQTLTQILKGQCNARVTQVLVQVLISEPYPDNTITPIKAYRVIDIQRTGTLTKRITLLKYNSAVYDNIFVVSGSS